MTDTELRAELRWIITDGWVIRDIDSLIDEMMDAFAAFKCGDDSQGRGHHAVADTIIGGEVAR